MSTKKVKDTPVQEPEVTEPATPVQPEETPRVKNQTGIVANCSRLNVRDKDSLKGNVVCIIDAGAKVRIDTAKSTDEWYKVRTKTGEEGFCMKKYITIQ